MKHARFALVGVGGFAGSYLKSLERCSQQGLASLDAVVIRNPKKDNYAAIEEDLRGRGARIYRDFKKMIEQEKASVDIIAIPSGIHHHADLSITALEAGFHVICEKPAAGTAEEAFKMQEAADTAERSLTIGYQNIFSPSIQKIKQIKLSNQLGRLLSAKTYALWPRPESYYRRNGWAGKIRYDDKLIYDSPLQNAASHFLQNMLYAAGNSHHESAIPAAVYGECYRAKNIESADTQYIRVTTADDIRLAFTVTHACSTQEHPYTEYRFEHGLIRWFFGGRTEVFSEPPEDDTAGAANTAGATGTASTTLPLRKRENVDLVEQFDNGDVEIFDLVFIDTIHALQENRPPLCTIHNSLQHTIAINALFQSSGEIHTIPDTHRVTLTAGQAQSAKTGTHSFSDGTKEEDRNIVIKDIDAIVRKSFATEQSFFEAEVPWARKGEMVQCG